MSFRKYYKIKKILQNLYHLCAIDQLCRLLVWVELRGWIFEIEFLRKLIVK